MDEVVELQPDNEGRSEHGDGDHILHNNKQTAQHHLGMEAERALHDVDGLIAGDMP